MLPKARSEELIIKEIEGEVVVYDLRSNRVHRLNRASAIIWRACDGQRDPAQIAKVLASRTDLPPDEQVVQLGLDELRRSGLLEDGTASGSPLSRRALFRSLGIATAAALPIVTTIVAPKPARAQSAPTTPTSTTSSPTTTPTTFPPTTFPPTTFPPTTSPPTTSPPTTPPPTTFPPTTSTTPFPSTSSTSSTSTSNWSW